MHKKLEMEEIFIKLQNILASFLGEPKNDMTRNGQCQFGCPYCIATKGEKERNKHNLEVNCVRGVYRCWSCGEFNEDMHGSIHKLFKIYGNEQLWKDYVNIIIEFKKSKMYELHFSKDDFNIDTHKATREDVTLPLNYHKFNPLKYNDKKALKYLEDRGIGWDIINEYHIGYTTFDRENLELSTRIILPSFNEYGELNYWTGRDFSGLKWKQKYFNPQTEKKEIIFNEDKIQWDADITLVEGPFDHIVVPNSIPLLGKSLKSDNIIFRKLMKQANANVNIFLDGDAYQDVLKVYKTLNHGKLYGKVRYVPVSSELDPSEIYKLYGKQGIIGHLKEAVKIDEVYLV